MVRTDGTLAGPSPRHPGRAHPRGLTTVLGVGSTPPLMSLLLGSLRPSSRALPAPGPFLRFSLARMDDSRSGKGGISSSTVAWRSRGGEGQFGSGGGESGKGVYQGGEGQGSDQDVGAGHRAEGEVLHGSLLQLHVSIAQLGAGPQHGLDGGLGLGEEVDELDVGGQQQRPRRHAAQVELGVEQGELHRGAVRGSGCQRGQASLPSPRNPLERRPSLGWTCPRTPGRWRGVALPRHQAGATVTLCPRSWD